MWSVPVKETQSETAVHLAEKVELDSIVETKTTFNIPVRIGGGRKFIAEMAIRSTQAAPTHILINNNIWSESGMSKNARSKVV